METKITSTQNKILISWVRKARKTKSQFNRDMGYSSNQGYLLLSNKRNVTYETIGRLLVVYGADGPAEQIAEALRRSEGRK